MPFARTLRFEWKTILFLCAVGGGLIYIAFDLYRAWAFGVIQVPRLIFGISRATLAHEPNIFRVAVVLDVLSLILMSLLLGFGIWSQWLQARGLRIIETRPSIDDAIREPPDER